jgi:hypothetical protein
MSKKQRKLALKDNLIHFEGGDFRDKKNPKQKTDVPDDFEVYSMDIFIQYDEFNDGFMHKDEIMIFIDFIDKQNLGDPKARE